MESLSHCWATAKLAKKATIDMALVIFTNSIPYLPYNSTRHTPHGETLDNDGKDDYAVGQG
jgi:hypothetical protein